MVHFDGFASLAGGGIDPVRGIVLAGGVFAYEAQPRPTGSDTAVARLKAEGGRQKGRERSIGGDEQ